MLVLLIVGGVVKWADTVVSKTTAARRAGSNPATPPPFGECDESNRQV